MPILNHFAQNGDWSVPLSRATMCVLILESKRRPYKERRSEGGRDLQVPTTPPDNLHNHPHLASNGGKRTKSETEIPNTRLVNFLSTIINGVSEKATTN